MKNCVICAIKKLAKVTAGFFLFPHKESFVFTNNSYLGFSCQNADMFMLRPRKMHISLSQGLLGRSS